MCSPDAARSKWVNKEIIDFKGMYGEGRILAVILSGEPNASDKAARGFSPDQECFPEALRYRLCPDGAPDHSQRTEPIAADVRRQVGDGEEKARIRVLAKLLDVNFDELWDREQRRKIRFYMHAAALATILLVAFGALSFYADAQRHKAIRQKELALQAINALTYEIPERLKTRPGMLGLLRDVFQKNNALLQEIHALDSGSPEAERERAVNFTNEGDQWLAMGQVDKALAAYEAGLEIRKSLAGLDPSNAQWRHGLAESHGKIGYVRASPGRSARRLGRLPGRA